MKKYGTTIFMILFLVLLLIPSVGMLVFGPSESENGEELVMPVIYSEEEGFNRNYLQELSDIFEQRFAFRKPSELIKSGCFHLSLSSSFH